MEYKQLAKQLLNYRLECELNFTNELRQKVVSAFKELCVYGYSGSLTPLDFQFNKLSTKAEINKVITDLCEWIFDKQVEYGDKSMDSVVDAYDIKKEMTAEEFINDYEYGHTDKERIRTYANRFKYEAEAWIASALIIGVPMTTLINQFSTNIQNPYNNSIFNQAVKDRSASATRLKTRGKSYGIGRYVSSFNSLKRLGRAVIADANKRSIISAYIQIGAKGFEVYRGSSYPCSLCDSMVGYHDINSIDAMPPYHCNCVCYTVPIFSF